MNKLMNLSKRYALFYAVALFALGCSNDSDDNNQDFEFTQAEVKTILETDGVSSVADSVISELYMGNSAKSAKNEECYSATYNDTGFNVTFNNCVLNGTENVNGTLNIVYANENESASFTATYTDFYVGEIKINGTRSFTLGGNSEGNSISFTVTSDMTLTLADDSVIAENGTQTLGFVFGQSLAESVFTVSGNWTLLLDGNTYKVAVGTTLEGNLGCGYLNKGIMTVDKNGLAVAIDFGDGSCDDKATVTYPDGTTEDISLKD
ncbi:hypothetical protein [Ulvibacterium marinum]|uniref:Lipocalin-like domain-containing protein n=1 Tax=Ulvibacterium marinum TaxID=2419782 RepID=A0A3B0C8Q9_9FLAO|nr:hypothetical protein [Ulvibacterium marinum]RKN81111.1 hypothetical protein D7Z94_09205 [Ulvibacterium marinum]